MDISTTGHPSRFVATAIDHPRLIKADAASIRSFLLAYDAYVREVTERARQLTGPDFTSTELTTPVRLQFCVDQEWLESIIDLGLITGVDTFSALSDSTLREYLSLKAEESREVITMEKLDKLVQDELHINMADKDARSRMESLFVSYQSLLRRNGLKWLTQENQTVAVMHVLSAVRPVSLQIRLRSDLSLTHHRLENDFKGFMAHAIKLSEAFQLVDNGPPSRENSNTISRKNRRNVSSPREGGKRNQPQKAQVGQHKTLPVCLWPPHRAKGYRHYLKDCTACPDDEKKVLFKALSDANAATGPSKSTRSQMKAAASPAMTDTKDLVTGRMTEKLSRTGSVQVELQDGSETVNARGRADDGSDESIVSSRIAEQAVLNGVGKMAKITPITLQVALKSGANAETFTFSRSWTPPRLVLKLSAGPLALLNVRFLVADADLAVEDLLIGLPVLRHLGVDTKTLLEERRDLLDGTDCNLHHLDVGTSKMGRVSRLMIARLNRLSDCTGNISGPEHGNRDTSVNYYDVREEMDPFPDASLLDPADADQADAVKGGLENCFKKPVKTGCSLTI